MKRPDRRIERTTKLRIKGTRIALILFALGAGIALLMYHDNVLSPIMSVLAAADADPVPKMVLKKEPFVLKVPGIGEVVGRASVPIATPNTPSGGLRVAWLIPEGSIVSSGDTVVRFDSTDAMLNLEQQQNLLQANQERTTITEETQRADAKVLTIDRTAAELDYEYALQVLPEDRAIFSEWDIIEAKIDAETAKDRIDFLTNKGKVQRRIAESEQQILTIERNKAETEIAMANQTLRSLEVKSPKGGLVVYRLDRDREPQVGDEAWPGQVLAEIIDLATLDAKINVLERDGGTLVPGKEALIRLDAIPAMEFRGTISSVSGTAQPLERNSPLKYFSCQAAIRDFGDVLGSIRPGMALKAEIVLEAYDSCFVVPASAVTKKGAETLVYVLEGDAFMPRPVTLGVGTYGQCTILSGVDEGEVIASSNPFETRKAYLPDFSKGVQETQNQPPRGPGMRGRPQ